MIKNRSKRNLWTAVYVLELHQPSSLEKNLSMCSLDTTFNGSNFSPLREAACPRLEISDLKR
jgi:hypothetical protein